MRTRPYWVALVFAMGIVCTVIGSPVLAGPPSEALSPPLQGNNVSEMNLGRGSDLIKVMTMNRKGSKGCHNVDLLVPNV